MNLLPIWRSLTVGVLQDIKDNSFVSWIWSHFYLAKGLIAPKATPRRLDALLKSCRRLSFPPSRRLLASQLKPFIQGEYKHLATEAQVGWERYGKNNREACSPRSLNQSLLLKAPGPNGEKGVIYVSFEYNWMRLVMDYDLRSIMKDYYIVCQTSWSPTDYAALIASSSLSTDPLFVGVSNFCDIDMIQILSPVAMPIPILACDWNDPNHFMPKPHANRSIDIVMLANWSRTKRHWLLFEALRKMPKELRVVFIGRDAPGRTVSDLRREAKLFGVKQDIEIHKNLENKEVAEVLCDSKISTILTKREGSCVAVTESMFSGTPVAMSVDGHVGAKAYINERTGILVRRNGLARQLMQFLETSQHYSPRTWAIENISSEITSERLNKILREYAHSSGQPWTRDIAKLCWKYVPDYLYSTDKANLRSAVSDLKTNFGVVMDEFLGERVSAEKRNQ